MKRIIHYRKICLVLSVAAMAITSCSDEWDNHYQPSALTGERNLWTTIESHPELSNFASVVKAVGYDRALNGSQTFSVFAPVNNVLSIEQAQSLITAYQMEKAAGKRDNENSAVKEFIQNYIMLYSRSASSVTNDSLMMMNGKYQTFTSSAFAGKQLLTSNVACSNGVLYTVDGLAQYFPNIFEYLGKDKEIDSLANFVYAFNRYRFDASKSVPGDIVNGKTQYLDSVITLRNELLENYLAPVNSEDSSYWMVVPTNEVWQQLVPQYERYFQYDESVGGRRDSLTWLQARLALIRGTVFSRTRNTDAVIQDSALSTEAVSYRMRKFLWGSYDDKYYQYSHPLEESGVFNGTTNVQCSNGQVMKAKEWHISPQQTFLRKITAEGENSARLDSVDQSSTTYPATTYRVATSNAFYGKVGNNAYVELSPVSRTNITAYFSLPNLLSNVGYDIYVVTTPAIAGDENASDMARLPTKFRVFLRHQSADGILPSLQRDWITLDGNHNLSAVTWETTKDKIDTFKIASNIKVPYTTYAIGQAAKVELVFNTTPTTRQVNNGIYNRILRIDRIIVIPHEDTSDNGAKQSFNK